MTHALVKFLTHKIPDPHPRKIPDPHPRKIPDPPNSDSSKTCKVHPMMPWPYTDKHPSYFQHSLPERTKDQSGDEAAHYGYCTLPHTEKCVAYQGSTQYSSDRGLVDAPGCCSGDQGKFFTGNCCNNSFMPPQASMGDLIDCRPLPPTREIKCEDDTCFNSYNPGGSFHDDFDTNTCTDIQGCTYSEVMLNKEGKRLDPYTEKNSDVGKILVMCLNTKNDDNLTRNFKSTLSQACIKDASVFHPQSTI